MCYIKAQCLLWLLFQLCYSWPVSSAGQWHSHVRSSPLKPQSLSAEGGFIGAQHYVLLNGESCPRFPVRTSVSLWCICHTLAVHYWCLSSATVGYFTSLRWTYAPWNAFMILVYLLWLELYLVCHYVERIINVSLGTWRRNHNHIWQVLMYARTVFYKINTMEPLNPEAAVL